jgi:hypothetical protein
MRDVLLDNGLQDEYVCATASGTITRCEAIERTERILSV